MGRYRTVPVLDRGRLDLGVLGDVRTVILWFLAGRVSDGPVTIPTTLVIHSRSIVGFLYTHP